MERCRKFRQGISASYVDLKKSFDSVHYEILLDIPRPHGLPVKITDLTTSLYSRSEGAVMCGGGIYGFFS